LAWVGKGVPLLSALCKLTPIKYCAGKDLAAALAVNAEIVEITGYLVKVEAKTAGFLNA